MIIYNTQCKNSAGESGEGVSTVYFVCRRGRTRYYDRTAVVNIVSCKQFARNAYLEHIRHYQGCLYRRDNYARRIVNGNEKQGTHGMRPVVRHMQRPKPALGKCTGTCSKSPSFLLGGRVFVSPLDFANNCGVCSFILRIYGLPRVY